MSGYKQKSANPTVAAMVIDAITVLNERKGSSLQAIKKFVATKYSVNMNRHASLICRYLVSAVEKGELIRPRGTGASGSFKLGNAQPKNKKESKPKVVKEPMATVVPEKLATTVDEKKGNVTVKKAEPKPKVLVAVDKAPAKSQHAERKAPERKQQMEKKIASPKIPKAPKAVKSPKKAVTMKTRAMK